MWLDPLHGVGYQFGHWLAGFIDGEGCFLISYRRDRGSWYCQFRIRVRADDEAIIREIHERTGIGRFFIHPQKDALPLACWEVSSRSDCLQLVALLEQFPLRAKKARDFKIWRQAVEAWQESGRGGSTDHKGRNAEVWSSMETLAQELRTQRRFLEIAA